MGLKNYTWDKIFSLLIVPSLLENDQDASDFRNPGSNVCRLSCTFTF